MAVARHLPLSDAEAAARLRAEGPNELATAERRGLLHTLFGVLREPMLLLLVATGALYLVIGDLRDALALLTFVVIVLAITLVQERKTERAVEALRDLASPRALVIRDGARKRIPGREVVRGDFMVLAEGDRVPADGVLVEATNLSVDESLLTGESVPVRKRPGGDVDAPPGGDDHPTVFSGTLVVSGQGIAEVRATGAKTAVGGIGDVLSAVAEDRTPLQRDVDQTVRRIAIAAVTVCATIVLVHGLVRGDWLRGVLAGLTLAMALLPEELPVVLTVFQAIGAWRIAKSNVLTRRIPAIEALGSATVLCTDKTGTLTLNRMRVASLWTEAIRLGVESHPKALPEEVHALVEYGILASAADPFDPMELAFHELGRATLAHSEHLHATWRPLRAYPLAPDLLAMSHVYRAGGRFLIAAKGAPEAIVDLCHLPPADAERVHARALEMAGAGMRVLAVARAEHVGASLPQIQHDFDFEFLGLIGLVDPIRDSVPAAVAECLAAGVRVVMITGDHPETARAIGAEIGLPPSSLLTGSEVEAMSDAELLVRTRTTTIYARMVPEQKLRLVRALIADGEIVAMTGDGVNDAPALKAATIGIAMGGRGTDVAREAAALVLTDDDFSSIVAALRHGRRIFDNLKKATVYVMAVHVPIAGLAVLPVLFGWPMVLHPIHVAFLQLVIDPVCSIAFEVEAEEPGLMQRPPRARDAPLFDRRGVSIAMLQGASVFVACFGLYLIARVDGAEHARTIAFTSLMSGNVALILANRSWSQRIVSRGTTKNRFALSVSVVALLVLVLVIEIPALHPLFGFVSIEPGELVAALLSGFVALSWFEILKTPEREVSRPPA